MRALTLQPQWAHAVAHLGKRVENRSRAIPRALVGERIAIHAGATLPPGWLADLVAACPTPIMGGGGKGVPGWTAPIAPWSEAREKGREIATRAIVAVATVRPHEPSALEWREAGRGRLIADWRATLPAWADPYAKEWWALTDVQRHLVPVPVRRGQLGLWRLPDDEAAAVDAAAKEAA